MSVRVCVCVRMREYVCVCVRACMHVRVLCVYVCVCTGCMHGLDLSMNTHSLKACTHKHIYNHKQTVHKRTHVPTPSRCPMGMGKWDSYGTHGNPMGMEMNI